MVQNASFKIKLAKEAASGSFRAVLSAGETPTHRMLVSNTK